jgi:Fur family peroxide stress response transcriptional regulator
MVKTRNSLQKRVIRDALAVMDHPTATEVYERVRGEHPQISLGTVYRNLGTLAQDGDALRLSFAGEADRFDPNTHEHYHAVCTSCGAVFDVHTGIEPAIIQKMDKAVQNMTGIKITQHNLVFEGICTKCQ